MWFNQEKLRRKYIKLLNMKKIFTIISLAAMAAWTNAAPLTPEQAIGRLMSQDGRSKAAALNLEISPVYTAMTPEGIPGVYVFNNKDGKGYKILSADDAAFAVLGYSDEGCIDASNMPPQLKWWLGENAKQIAYNTSKGLKATGSAPTEANLKSIAPLCTTKWNQDAPYNNMAPLLENRKTYTGCVATSMAQVMKYHRYPEKGTGSNSYAWSRGGKTLTMNFDEKEFDWDNMLDVYRANGYTPAESDAVAYLMKACGYSVDMNYGTSASGTQGVLIAAALVKYFNYDGNCHAAYRMAYSASEWNQMVYDNIANCGPMIFNGHPYNDGGHSFICDGYDGHGYYHFNWGWGGTSDGYYLLETMNPEEQGIGGAGSTGFVYGLNGIFGIQKPTGDPIIDRPDNILMYGGCYAEGNAKRLQFYNYEWYPTGWYCAMPHDIKVNIGAIFEPVDGTPGETVTRGGTFAGGVTVSLTPGSYYNTTNGPVINVPNLPDGKYKVTIAVSDRNIKNAPYVPIITSYPCANYIYLTLENGEATIQNIPVPKMTPVNLEAGSLLYSGKNVKLIATFKNDTDYELTESLAAVLIKDDAIKYMGSILPVVVGAHSEEENVWITKFSSLTGTVAVSEPTEFTLGIADPITNNILATFGTVTMNKSITQGKLQLNKFEIDGCETVNETIGSKTVPVYQVPTSKFDVTLDYIVTAGFFDGYVNVNIEMPEADNLSNTVVMYDGVFRNYPFLSKDEQGNDKFEVNYYDGEANQLYILNATYKPGIRVQDLGVIYFRMKETGITDAAIENAEADTHYYNLQGVEIKNPAPGQIVIMKKGAKVSKIKI